VGSDEAIDQVRRVPRPLLLTVLALAVILVGILGATLANAIPGVSAPQVRVADVSALSPTGQQSTPTTASTTPAACICPSVKGKVPKPSGGVPKVAGQLILVSTTQQWLWAYDNGKLVLASPVTTGRPELPTPKGHYTVMNKQTNITFYSPWPVGSPFYYYPTHINYAMQFKAGGFFIHDAWWRYQFGPGSQFVHRDGDGSETGTHGCVNLPEDTTYALFYWVHVGTPVIIV
jgi:lipoprotein-anchoring transpeptidase ErfK/SrfK